MSIPGVTGASRITATVLADASTAPAADATRETAYALPHPPIDAVTQQPMPPRFPWLSRLSQQLESAARQKPAFASAPVLGDNIDRSA